MAPVARSGRLLEGEQPVDGRATHAQPLGDVGLGAVLSIKQPVDLGPLLHSEHSSLPGSVFEPGSVGNWVLLRQSVQFSTGAKCSVFTGVDMTHRMIGGKVTTRLRRYPVNDVRHLSITEIAVATCCCG